MEKLLFITPQFVKKFPAFYGTGSFTMNFTHSATGSCAESNVRSLQQPILLLEYFFNIFLLSIPKQCNWALSFSLPTNVLHGKLPPRFLYQDAGHLNNYSAKNCLRFSNLTPLHHASCVQK